MSGVTTPFIDTKRHFLYYTELEELSNNLFLREKVHFLCRKSALIPY